MVQNLPRCPPIRGIGIVCDIIGGGNQRAQNRPLADDLGIGKNIRGARRIIREGTDIRQAARTAPDSRFSPTTQRP